MFTVSNYFGYISMTLFLSLPLTWWFVYWRMEINKAVFEDFVKLTNFTSSADPALHTPSTTLYSTLRNRFHFWEICFEWSTFGWFIITLSLIFFKWLPRVFF